MSLRCLTLVAICVVFICTEAVSGEDVKKSVGDKVYFRPDKVVPPVSSIIWKHKTSLYTVKVIEWDVEDGVSIPHPRFKDITTLDEKTGQITITNLTVEHSGLYTIDINSKDQEQIFNLTVTGEEVKNVVGVVGGTVSFHPTKVNPPVSSIIWKHKNSSGVIVKVIEGDSEDGESIPNQRFKEITTLDEKTGQITNLNIEHSGLYTTDFNSKQQEQIFNLAVMGEEVKNVVVGGTVSFGPTSINPSVSSIIWKHKRSSGVVVKAIEWDADDDSVTIPHPRFKDITTLDEKTGQITITNLTVEHSGLYTIDINSKEHEQRFKLEILPPVPKPEIKIKIKINPNAVCLICEYSDTIIWKNSAGDTLKGSEHSPKGEVLTVLKTGNPDVFYTCTLKNEVSEETSDPVYEKDLFED